RERTTLGGAEIMKSTKRISGETTLAQGSKRYAWSFTHFSKNGVVAIGLLLATSAFAQRTWHPETLGGAKNGPSAIFDFSSQVFVQDVNTSTLQLYWWYDARQSWMVSNIEPGFCGGVGTTYEISAVTGGPFSYAE